MSAAEAREPRLLVTEAPRALLELAVGTREDWGREQTWQALHACHAAGWPWEKTVKRVTALLFREGSEPRELRDEARATRRKADTGPQVFARGMALARAAIEPRNDHDGEEAACATPGPDQEPQPRTGN